ncbi:hypothetical protein NPIL_460521 [Nephila pilipes]|uniref:Uncharacterized protein n=1 Tax=Nephila pilipes TaxID=299642 RepID=A0A8X6MQS8_NEPPI|nr:hypothetical protein NPIL_460521 [Nephila pilipes]
MATVALNSTRTVNSEDNFDHLFARSHQFEKARRTGESFFIMTMRGSLTHRLKQRHFDGAKDQKLMGHHARTAPDLAPMTSSYSHTSK